MDVIVSRTVAVIQTNILKLKRLAILDNAHAAQGGQKKDKDLIPTKLFEFPFLSLIPNIQRVIGNISSMTRAR